MRAWLVPVVLLSACQRKPPPTCDAMADHVLELMMPADDFARASREVFLGRCRQDAWPESARACVIETQNLGQPRNCKEQLTPEQAKALDRDLAAAAAREAGKQLPPQCDHYGAILAEVVKCDALPADVRAQLSRRYAEEKARWATLPDKSTLAPMCGAGVDALKRAASECPGAKNW